MGSPMVFHTAPPQPASKARMTCSPQLVGGPEASQKGLGQRMPAKLVVRSAMVHHSESGAFAVGDGVHHFAAAVDAIAAGVVFGVAGAACGPVDPNGAAADFEREHGGEARLPEGGDDEIAGHFELAAGDGFGDTTAFGVGRAELGGQETHGGG